MCLRTLVYDGRVCCCLVFLLVSCSVGLGTVPAMQSDQSKYDRGQSMVSVLSSLRFNVDVSFDLQP